MTDSSDADSAKSSGSLRKRASIYGERTIMSLRMGTELNRRMLDYCDEVHTPANTYVIGLLTSALALPDPSTVSDPNALLRGEDKVNVSIRVDPKLYMRCKTHCEQTAPRVSATAFICGLIARDLTRRKK